MSDDRRLTAVVVVDVFAKHGSTRRLSHVCISIVVSDGSSVAAQNKFRALAARANQLPTKLDVIASASMDPPPAGKGRGVQLGIERLIAGETVAGWSAFADEHAAKRRRFTNDPG